MKPNPNFNSLHYLFKESEHSVEVTHFLTNFLFDLITIYQRINPDKKAFTDAQISTIEEISKRINSPEWLENNLSEFFSVIDTLMEQGLEEGSKLEVKKILMEQGLEEGLKLEVKKISMEQGLEEELNLEIKKIKASIKIHALIREFSKLLNLILFNLARRRKWISYVRFLSVLTIMMKSGLILFVIILAILKMVHRSLDLTISLSCLVVFHISLMNMKTIFQQI